LKDKWRLLMNSTTRSIAVPVLLVLLLAFISFGCGSSSGRGSAVPTNQVAEPSVDRPAGYFVDPIDVTISPGIAGTFGDTIVYTIDNSDPSCASGTAYASTTITVNGTTNLKAVACMDGYDESDVLEVGYIKLLEDARVIAAVGDTPINRAIRLASPGDIIYIEPGVYPEANGEVVINKPITLIGAGSGVDSAKNTIITDAPSNQNVIAISSGGTASTLVAIRNLRVTGSLGPGGNEGAGLEIRTADGHIEIDNVAAVGNSGNGISFDPGGEAQNIIIKNSVMSSNGWAGFRVPTTVGSIDGLTINNCVVRGNTGAGAMFYPLTHSGSTSTNIYITNSTFEGNGTSSDESIGDIIFTGFAGNAVISTVSVVSNGTNHGIRISGNSSGSSPNKEGAFAAGSITLSNLNISGTQRTPVTYTSGALVFTRYLGLSRVNFDNVVLDSTGYYGLFLGTITMGGGPNLGNLSLGNTYSVADIYLGQHGDSSSYKVTDIPIDATSAAFQGASDDLDIEARINHWNDDPLLGLVDWTTP
jgi:hypothetical protein